MSRELLKRISEFAQKYYPIQMNGLIAEIEAELKKPDPEPDALRYAKLRSWMSSNVKEGWQEVERLGAIAACVNWDEFDKYLDELPECNVGLCERRATL